MAGQNFVTLCKPDKDKAADVQVWDDFNRTFKPWDGRAAYAFFGLALVCTAGGTLKSYPTVWYSRYSAHADGVCSGKAYACPVCAAFSVCLETYHVANGRMTEGE